MSSIDRIRATHEAGAGGAAANNAGVEREAQLAWQRNPAIRAEFIEEAHYVAYEKARAAGKFKVLGRGEVR